MLKGMARKKSPPKKYPVVISFGVDLELLNAIEEYRFSHRIPSRLQALRELVGKGLDTTSSPPPA